MEQLHLVLTYPVLEDLDSFHELCLDEDIKKEFQNFSSYSLEKREEHLNYWIKQNIVGQKGHFLQLIKLTTKPDSYFFDNNNSRLVGFIYNSDSQSDSVSAGIQNINLLSFAVHSEFRNYGVMTNALKLIFAEMIEREYGYACAFVKSNNLPSQRVLEKAGFVKVRDAIGGKLYGKNLCWTTKEFYHQFQ